MNLLIAAEKAAYWEDVSVRKRSTWLVRLPHSGVAPSSELRHHVHSSRLFPLIRTVSQLRFFVCYYYFVR